MSFLILLLILCAVFAVGLLVCGLGIGALLHWLFPSIDLGTATVIGLLASGFALRAVQNLLPRLPSLPDEEETAEDVGQAERVFHLVEAPENIRRRKKRAPRK